MPDTVKIPLLGTHKKRTIIIVGVLGAGLSGYMIVKYEKNKQTQAAITAATATTGYGYGSGYGYGAESGYGYGSGYYGYGEGGGGQSFFSPQPIPLPTPPPTPVASGKVKVPDVIGLSATEGATIVKAAGLKVKHAGPGKIVQERPPAETQVKRKSTVTLFGANK